MYFISEKSRDKTLTAEEKLHEVFASLVTGECDAEFCSWDKKRVIGACGLSMYMPLALYIVSDAEIAAYTDSFKNESHLFSFDGEIRHYTDSGEKKLPEAIREKLAVIGKGFENSPGYIDDNGAQVIDLLAYPVGTHFDVNLLLGNRIGYDNPLLTTPKAALDSLGRGSFRASADNQVLASRFVLRMEENGEPVNRQFYLYENDRQIFYSAEPSVNVKSGTCRHMPNRTVITYETECGLKITRTIFILPQEDGMPDAAEAQRVEIENLSEKQRSIKIVFTGMFGIYPPDALANDIMYVNIVHESEVMRTDDGRVWAITPNLYPRYARTSKLFASLLCEGEPMDEFSVNYNEFFGRGTVTRPENGARLSCRQNRKAAPFFAMAKSLSLAGSEKKIVDSYCGRVSSSEDVRPQFDSELHNFIEKYKNPAALEASLKMVEEFVTRYSSYITFKSEDKMLNSYISANLPFQVLYQSYVTRSFAWTQKSARQVGFREIQDMYASMYYMNAMGEGGLAADMISQWAKNVYRDGYANHNFYWQGKGAGDSSDDQLWLIQAVYRYVMLTDDKSFIDTVLPIADGGERPLFDTMKAAIQFSGEISVGKHGLPLLDNADWNDCLNLDPDSISAPEKMRRYREQLKKNGQEYGVPFENHYCESIMNAFLLKLACDELCEMARLTGRSREADELEALSKKLYGNIQKHCWKDDFFARCLINNDNPGHFTYLGGKGDGLSSNPDFPGSYWLNSFSWSILSGCATEKQIEIMMDSLEKYIKTPSGLTLTSPCALNLISSSTALDHYFHGDRENGAVFKHATMMSTAAMFKACKSVKSDALAKRLAETGFWMLDLVLPYQTMKTPFITKGNPRFCTQYNNSETRENIGPMLSGTASWLSLTTFEFLGIRHIDGGFDLCPVLPFDMDGAQYTVRIDSTVFDITVTKKKGFSRPCPGTSYSLDGKKCTSVIKNPRDGKLHTVRVEM